VWVNRAPVDVRYLSTAFSNGDHSCVAQFTDASVVLAFCTGEFNVSISLNFIRKIIDRAAELQRPEKILTQVAFAFSTVPAQNRCGSAL
jgi:hypothetical protein